MPSSCHHRAISVPSPSEAEDEDVQLDEQSHLLAKAVHGQLLVAATLGHGDGGDEEHDAVLGGRRGEDQGERAAELGAKLRLWHALAVGLAIARLLS